jgi:hypothetical protein
MGLAKQERIDAANGKGCLGKAADDEPVFILRAQDKIMAAALHVWIDEMVSYRGNAHPKVVEAKELLDKVRKWQAENPTKYPD